MLPGDAKYLGDTNVWLALALSGHMRHNLSCAWLDTINEPGVIHFCRATQQSFVRLLTNRTVLGAYGSLPLTNDEAWAAYAAFLDDDRIVMASREPDGLEVQWKAFAVCQSPAPKVWMDAYLAAFALTGGFELVTTDNDFMQYRGIGLRLLTQQAEDTIRAKREAGRQAQVIMPKTLARGRYGTFHLLTLVIGGTEDDA